MANPTDIILSNNIVNENVLGAVVGTLQTIDEDLFDSFTYTVDDARFSCSCCTYIAAPSPIFDGV